MAHARVPETKGKSEVPVGEPFTIVYRYAPETPIAFDLACARV